MARLIQRRAPTAQEVQESFPESVLSDFDPEEVQSHEEEDTMDFQMIQSQLQAQLADDGEEEEYFDPAVISNLNALLQKSSPSKPQAIAATANKNDQASSDSKSGMLAGPKESKGNSSLHMKSPSTMVENSNMDGSKTLITISARRQLKRVLSNRSSDQFMETVPDLPKSDPYEMQESREMAMKKPAAPSKKRERKSMEADDDSEDSDPEAQSTANKKQKIAQATTTTYGKRGRGRPPKMLAKRSKQKPLVRRSADSKDNVGTNDDMVEPVTTSDSENEALAELFTTKTHKARAKKNTKPEAANAPTPRNAFSSPELPERPDETGDVPSSPPLANQNIQVVIPSIPHGPKSSDRSASSSPVVRRSPRTHFKNAPVESADLSQNPTGSSWKVLESITKSRPKTVSPELQHNVDHSPSVRKAITSSARRAIVKETPPVKTEQTGEVSDEDAESETDEAALAAMGISQSLQEDLEYDEYMPQEGSLSSIEEDDEQYDADDMVMDYGSDVEMEDADAPQTAQVHEAEGITDILMNPSPVKPPSQKIAIRQNGVTRDVEPRSISKCETKKPFVLSDHPTMDEYELHFVSGRMNNQLINKAERNVIKKKLKELQASLCAPTENEWNAYHESITDQKLAIWSPSLFRLWNMSFKSFSFLTGSEKLSDLRAIICKLSNATFKEKIGISFAEGVRKISQELVDAYDKMQMKFIVARTVKKDDVSALEKAEQAHRDIEASIQDLLEEAQMMKDAIIDPVESQIWDNYRGFEIDQVRVFLLHELYHFVICDIARVVLAATDCYCFGRTPNETNLSEIVKFTTAALELLDTARKHKHLDDRVFSDRSTGVFGHVETLYICLDSMADDISMIFEEHEDPKRHQLYSDSEDDDYIVEEEQPKAKATKRTISDPCRISTSHSGKGKATMQQSQMSLPASKPGPSRRPASSQTAESIGGFFDDDDYDMTQQDADDVDEHEVPKVNCRLPAQKAKPGEEKRAKAKREEEKRLAKLKAFEEEGRRMAEQKAKMYPGSQPAPTSTRPNLPPRRNIAATQPLNDDPFAIDLPRRHDSQSKANTRPNLIKQIGSRSVVKAADPTYMDDDAMLVDENNYVDDSGEGFADVDLDELRRLEEKKKRRRARAVKAAEEADKANRLAAEQEAEDEDDAADSLAPEVGGSRAPEDDDDVMEIERVKIFDSPERHVQQPRAWTKTDALNLVRYLKTDEVYTFDDLASILGRSWDDVAQKCIEMKPIWEAAYTAKGLNIPDWIDEIPDSMEEAEEIDEDEKLPDVEDVRRQGRLERLREVVRNAVRQVRQ